MGIHQRKTLHMTVGIASLIPSFPNILATSKFKSLENRESVDRARSALIGREINEASVAHRTIPPGNLPRQKKKAGAARANALHDMTSGISNTVQQSTISRSNRVRAQAASGIFCGALVSSLYHNIPQTTSWGL